MGEICFKLNDCQELEFFKRYVWGTCLSKQVFEAQVTNEKVKAFEYELLFHGEFLIKNESLIAV